MKKPIFDELTPDEMVEAARAARDILEDRSPAQVIRLLVLIICFQEQLNKRQAPARPVKSGKKY